MNGKPSTFKPTPVTEISPMSVSVALRIRPRLKFDSSKEEIVSAEDDKVQCLHSTLH
jgi:hypothetical protein